MTFKICYWDDTLKQQRERDSTPEEDAQRALDIAAASVEKVPFAVTMRQARRALFDAGLLSAVETAINNLSEPTKSEARIEWDFSKEVERNRGLVSTMASALGLTSQQLDQLFITASKIE